MSKAKLIIDMPENCVDCKYLGFREGTNNTACMLTGNNTMIQNVGELDIGRDIACPLKPMPKGEWIRDFDGNEFYWYCSSCKENYYEEDLYLGGNEFPNFCPNCGADMRGRKE